MINKAIAKGREVLDRAFLVHRNDVIDECIATIGIFAYPRPSSQRTFADELVAELQRLKRGLG